MVDRTRSGSRKAPGALRLPGLRATGCKLVACSAAPSEQAITEMDAVPAMALHRVFGPWTGWVACHAVHAHPTRGLDCPSYSVVVLAQWQLVSLHEVPVSPSIRSEEHTSELQSLMRISYAVFCLKKKNKTKRNKT